jgi:uncharacterized protein (TIGR00369 family)
MLEPSLAPSLRDAFERVPVNAHLGLRLLARTSERCEVALTPAPRHLQGEGLVQGGVLAALADTAAVYLLLPDLESGRTVTSVEFKLNFLAPARVDAGELRAVAKPIQRGRTISVCDVDVHQAERQVAKGLFTYLEFDVRR